MSHTQIPLFSGTVPNRNQAANVFADNADDWLVYQASLAADYNALATVVDAQAAAADVSATAAAISEANASTSENTAVAAANFKGRWSDATGAATVPASYSNNGQTWQLLQDIADITADEPVVGAVNWQVIDDVNMANVRLSKLNNPITHLFKKNNLVEVLRGSMSVTRSTIATYVDRYGIVQTALPDIPREEKEGWLIEGASTNLALHSEEFDNAAWTVNEATISSDVGVAPDSSNTADKLVENTSNGTHLVGLTSSVTITDGQRFTLSVFVKPSGRQFIQLTAVITLTGVAVFDVLTGVVISTSGTGDPQATITSMGYGWYMCQLHLTAASTSARLRVTLHDGVSTSYTGDGASGVFIWGAQIEELPFASSYIKTTTVGVTRAADVITIDALDNLPFQSDATLKNMTITLSMDSNITGVVGTKLLQVSGGSTFIVEATAAASRNINFFLGTAVVVNANYSGNIDLALVVENDLINVFIDSVGKTPSAAGAMTGTFTTVHIGSNSSSVAQMFGHISDFRIYDFALNLDEIKLLSGN